MHPDIARFEVVMAGRRLQERVLGVSHVAVLHADHAYGARGGKATVGCFEVYGCKTDGHGDRLLPASDTLRAHRGDPRSYAPNVRDRNRSSDQAWTDA